MPTPKIKRGYRKTRYILYKETLIDYKEQFWSFLGSFVGIGILAYMQDQQFTGTDAVFLIASFGASSVLVYGIIHSPFSQPRNLIGGHLVSGFIGVTVNLLIPDIMWIAAALSVSLAIVLMQITKTLHPPGGATALIAVVGGEQIKDLGYWYLVSPILIGVLVLFLTALVFNNMTSSRVYPSHSTYHKHYHRIRKRLAQK